MQDKKSTPFRDSYQTKGGTKSLPFGSGECQSKFYHSLQKYVQFHQSLSKLPKPVQDLSEFEDKLGCM